MKRIWLEKDGTLQVLTDESLEDVKRVLVTQKGSLYGGLFYPDSEKRPKGKWIKMSDADGIYWACSECGENLPRVDCFDPQFDLFPKLKSIDKTKYCSHCGAEMGEDT